MFQYKVFNFTTFFLLFHLDSEDESNEPKFSATSIKHAGTVNRLKFTALNAHNSTPVVAAWSDNGSVGIYDLSAAIFSLNNNENKIGGKKNKKKDLNDIGLAEDPLMFSFKGHSDEGFALDWSPTVSGNLISGDLAGKIHIWLPHESTWSVDKNRPFSEHEDSVEDLQWSPTEKAVFSSCSTDKSIRVWDVRSANRSKSQLKIKNAHESDVNVISWNRKESSLLLSGGDDGVLKVWDFRNPKKPVACFEHHTQPITSVQWCPHDSSVFAASGEDDQITLWDCGVEPDEDENANTNGEEDSLKVPPQLLFIHQGQKEIKEIRWYPHSVGVVLSVASTGLDVFRTVSV